MLSFEYNSLVLEEWPLIAFKRIHLRSLPTMINLHVPLYTEPGPCVARRGLCKGYDEASSRVIPFVRFVE